VDLALTLLLWLLCILGGLLLLFLLLPVHVSADGEANVVLIDGEAEARWAWGLLSLRLTPERGAWVHLLGRPVRRLRRRAGSYTDEDGDENGDEDGDEDGDAEAPEQAEEADEPQGSGGRRGLGWALHHRRALLRVVKRLYRAMGVRARLEGALGLDDPTETAVLWGMLMQVQAWLPGLELAVRPDFMDEQLDLRGTLRGRIWLAHLLLIMAAQLLRADTRQMLRAP
jgi:hypothetical protein